MTCKKLTRQTPFRLVYGHEDVILMEYIVLSLRIVVTTEMTDVNAIEEILSQLLQLEEECFVVGFQQNVEKKDKKHGMIDTLRESTLRLEEFFLGMTTNFSSIQES